MKKTTPTTAFLTGKISTIRDIRSYIVDNKGDIKVIDIINLMSKIAKKSVIMLKHERHKNNGTLFDTF